MLNLTDKNDSPLLSKATVNDRRSQGSSSGTSVDRFKKRYERQIKRKFDETLTNGKIKDIAEGQVIDIPIESDKEYHIHKGQGGDSERVHPGNDQFTKGDLIKRPEGGGGGGSGDGDASNQGEGEDEFSFQISKEEYLDMLFDDLELPNLEMKELAKAVKYKFKRCGITNSGTPERLDIVRTKKSHKSRSFASGLPRLKRAIAIVSKTLAYVNKRLDGATAKKSEAIKASAQLTVDAENLLNQNIPASAQKNLHLSPAYNLANLCLTSAEEILTKKSITKAQLTKGKKILENLLNQLESMLSRKKRGAAMDESIDGIFANVSKVPEPSENAVMFCLMDVSGSMDQQTKDNAKRFYILLYLFLIRSYEDVDIVYIRYHTNARECDEEEFFYGRETGGTTASCALIEMNKVQKERYPADQWNIFAAQASDGDNWGEDNPDCDRLVRQMLKETVRYYIYVEITQHRHQEMWHTYKKISEETDKMAIGHIRQKGDIADVFREFFLKDKSGH